MNFIHGLAAAVAAWATFSAPVSAQSAHVCYELDNQVVGTTYRRSNVILTNFGSVRINDFYIDGVLYESQQTWDNQYLRVHQTQLAQGTAPEMHVSLVNVQFLPTQAVRGISMQVAQQVGVNGRLPGNLEVNGERLDFRGTLSDLSGTQLGGATLVANLVADPPPVGNEPPSHWHRGTLEVRADSGSVISSFSFGAQAANFDNVCFYY